jgi:hypothetical protein
MCIPLSLLGEKCRHVNLADGGNNFLWNFRSRSTDYTALYLKWYNSLYRDVFYDDQFPENVESSISISFEFLVTLVPQKPK